MSSNTNRLFSSTSPMIIASIVFFFLFFFQLVHREIIVYHQDLNRFEEAIFEEIKIQLSLELSNRMEEFDYIIRQTDAMTMTVLQEELVTLNGFYSYFKTEGLLEETGLLSTLYFATMNRTDDATLEIYNTDMERIIYNGTSFDYIPMDQSDAILGTDDTAYVLNYASYSGHIDHNHTTYITHSLTIDDSYIVIITVSLNEAIERIRTSIIQRFIDYYEDTDDYIFMINVQGDIYLHDSLDTIGKNVFTELDNAVFSSAFTTILDQLTHQTEAFVQYDFYDSAARTQTSERLAYVIYYDPFDMVVGKSVPLNVIDPLRESFRAQSLQSFFTVTFPIYIITISTALLAGFFIFHYAHHSSKTLLEEETLYERIASLSNQLIVITDKYGGILYTNPIGKIVLGRRESDYEEPLTNRLITQKDYLVLNGVKKDYFVRMTQEAVTYKHQEANLYFFEDITEDVKQKQELKKQSDTDELTTLYNRRRLMRDFTETFLKDVEAGKQGVLGIIDLDQFKKINDVHGHEYGDQVLIEISTIFKSHCYKELQFYRIGGDEFAVLSLIPRHELVELLRTLKKQIISIDFKGHTVSFTYGTVEVNNTDPHKRFSDYYSQADERLYQHKNK